MKQKETKMHILEWSFESVNNDWLIDWMRARSQGDDGKKIINVSEQNEQCHRLSWEDDKHLQYCKTPFMCVCVL